MTDDWFVEAVERVADAGRQACFAIDTAVGALQGGCEARNAGRPIVDIVDELITAGGRETRLIPYGGWFVKGGRGFGLRACTGPAPPASRVLRIAARRACGPPLTREPLPGPGQAFIGQARGLPDGCAQPEPAAFGVDGVTVPAQDRRREGRLVCPTPYRVSV